MPVTKFGNLAYGIFAFLVVISMSGCMSSHRDNLAGQDNSVKSNEPEALPEKPMQPAAISQPQKAVANNEPLSEPKQPEQPVENPDVPTLKLKSIGIDLDYLDPATNMAGDVKFTKGRFMFGIIFSDYGFVIPAESSAGGKDKSNPQPTFTLPMGTKVRSLVDGVVTNVPVLYSGDYSIHVATNPRSRWIYETEHVINPLVKVGDQVKAGQVIAEVSPHNKDANDGFGIVEIGILRGGNPPQHVCPFAYLDESIKEDVQKKLTALYKSWEEYRGDSSLYDESALKIPGCLTLDPIDG